MRTKYRKGVAVETMGQKFVSKKQAMFAMFRAGHTIFDICKKLDVERRNALYILRNVRKRSKYDPQVVDAFVSRNFGKV